MKARLQKRENSDGIRIPKSILTLNLKTNDKVEIEEQNEKIIIKKSNKTLKEKIEEYDGPNLSKEFEWDDPVGKEIW